MATLTSTGIKFSSTDQINTRRWIFQGSSDPGGAAHTNWIFYQSSAPTGWTKRTDHDNKALRVVSGTGGGTGGSQPFTTVCSPTFAYAGTLNTTTASGYREVTLAGLPWHDHSSAGIIFASVPAVYNPDGSFAYWNGGDVGRAGGFTQSTPNSTYGPSPGSSGYSHFHPVSASGPVNTTLTLGVYYIDVIVCSFNG